MKTFHYAPPNIFAKKTYTVSQVNDQTSHVTVQSPFLGKWSFDINMQYAVLTHKLNRYSSEDLLIQNIFPALSSIEREKFLSDPELGV